VGRAILQRLIDDARALGYRTIRLDSARFMREAHALYRRFGFVPSSPHKWEFESMPALRQDRGLHAPRFGCGLANSGVAFGLLGRLARLGCVQNDPRRDEFAAARAALSRAVAERAPRGTLLSATSVRPSR
jgi:hypothetical protein